MVTLRLWEALLEETKANVETLTKSLDAVGTEKDIAILEAKARVAKAVANFKGFDDF